MDHAERKGPWHGQGSQGWAGVENESEMGIGAQSPPGRGGAAGKGEWGWPEPWVATVLCHGGREERGLLEDLKRTTAAKGV